MRDATNDAEEDVVAMWDVIMGFDGRDPEVFTPELHQYVATMLHRKLHPKKLRELATSVGTNHNENLWSMLVKFSHGKSLNQSGKFTWYNYACLAGKAQNVAADVDPGAALIIVRGCGAVGSNYCCVRSP